MMSITVRQTAILVLLFVLTSAALIALDTQRRFDAVRAPLSEGVHPFAALFSRAGDALSLPGDGRGDAELRAELERVTAERDRLMAENAQLKRLEQEVAELRRQLGFREAFPQLSVVSASVVGRDPRGAQKILIIDRGANDGIQKGMAVLSPDFFVGQVTEVEPERARVTLAIDGASQIGAVVQPAAGEQAPGVEGIVYGRWQAGGALLMRHLDVNAEVAEGDLVVTSGRTARVPQGLVIGAVHRVHRDVQADSLELTVAPFVDPDTLGSVAVIISDSSEPSESD